MLEVPKKIIANARWVNAQNKVNKAVNVLSSFGLGYSVEKGIQGNYKHLAKRDIKKITAASLTMGKLQAGYYPKTKNNNSNTPTKPIHYEPLEFSDYKETQRKSVSQSKSSMHLRAAQTFLQRVNYAPRLQSHPNKRVLGITAEESNNWSAVTEALWRQDRELKEWDEALINSYDQISDIALSQYLSIGEFFAVRRNYNNDPGRTTNLSIELFHPMQIQSPRLAFGNFAFSIQDSNCSNIVKASSLYYVEIEKKGHYIEKGIEYNSKNQEVAIFIVPEKFGEPYVRVPFYNSNGFQQVLHGFIQKEPGQKRGLPDGCYAWHEYMNIRDLARFEMQSARLNSTISGTVTADSNAQPNGQQGGIEDMGNKAGWNDIAPGTPASLSDFEPSYDVREVNGGGFVLQKFSPGYRYTEHNTSRPNLNIPVFIEKNLEFTYPATYGLSMTLVNQRLEGSYNASKGKIDLSWMIGVEYYLKQFSSDWHKPNYKAWLNGKIATGEQYATGWNDPILRNAWLSSTIITPAKPSLNPLQEAKAGKERISYGASTAEYEAQQQTGTSFDENIDRIKQENISLKEAFPVKEGVLDVI